MSTNQQNNRPLSLTKRTPFRLGAIALGLTMSLLAGCQEFTQADQPAEEGNVTSEDVTQVSEEDSAVGEIVTIRSGVSETLDSSGFIMESGDGESILIVNSTGTAFTPPDQEVPIQVTGQLETFDAAAVEQEYGLNLDPNLYGEYDQQPAIIARNFALAPRPQDLWDAPEGYFNETIAVEGDLRKLEETNNAFALFEEGWVDDIGVLVIGVDQLVDPNTLEDGENIVVTGQARQADENLLREANLGWDDSKIQEFLSRYTNRPVIVADEVYPSAVPPHPSI
ncbi:MAG: hypothetical protein Kow00121_01550 [Elainellaceae cyanobacterium]